MTPQYILRASLCREPHCIGEYERNHGGNARFAQSEIDNLGWADGYAEPGYDDPARGVLFANWNHFPSKVTDILERYGYAIEWSDEWTTCDDCGKALRTSPDSYGWQFSGQMSDEGTFCIDCTDPIDHLQKLEGSVTQANTIRTIDPTQHGYLKLRDDYENGFHPGQTDDPKRIGAELTARGITRFVFNIESVGQFDIRFGVYVHESQGDMINA